MLWSSFCRNIQYPCFMAIGKSTLFGTLSGSLGNIIVYTVGGQMRVRTKPGHYRDQKSPAQLAQRRKICQIAELYAQLSPQLLAYWKQLTTGTTLSSYNLFMRANIKNLDEQGEISDIRRFRICDGVLPLPPSVRNEMTPAGTIRIAWDTSTAEKQAAPSDKLHIAAYLKLKDKNDRLMILAETQIMRKMGEYEYVLPESIGPEAHFFLFFKSSLTNDITPAAYLGSIK